MHLRYDAGAALSAACALSPSLSPQALLCRLSHSLSIGALVCVSATALPAGTLLRAPTAALSAAGPLPMLLQLFKRSLPT